MTSYNKEKFNKLVSSNPPSKWASKHLERKTQRAWSKDSFTIALNVLTILEEKGWSKARLAKELSVSPAYITKVVKGKVNFTLESLHKLGVALGEPLIDIKLIDRQRQNRDYEQLIKWLSTPVSIKTTKSTNPYRISITPVLSFTTSKTLAIPQKKFNSLAMANDNLRPTG